MRMRTDNLMVKNEVEFRRYQKFESESLIKFDAVAPDALPDDVTTEQPVPQK